MDGSDNIATTVYNKNKTQAEKAGNNNGNSFCRW